MKDIKIPWLLFILALLLTACQGATQSAPDPTAGEIRTEDLADPTTTIQIRTPEAAAQDEPAAGASCTVVSPQPTPGPTEQSLFPPASADDWARGPDTAAVTIIEYSDFQ